MPPNNSLTRATPYAVDDALKRLGQNLRTARIRRNLTAAEIAARLGVGRHVIADAEAGKLTTGIGVYAGMLWALNLLEGLQDLASPENDAEGKILARLREPLRARTSREMNDDF